MNVVQQFFNKLENRIALAEKYLSKLLVNKFGIGITRFLFLFFLLVALAKHVYPK